MFHQVQIGKQNRIECNNNSNTIKKTEIIDKRRQYILL